MKNNIYSKILASKKEIGKISKDSKNPFFKSSYLSLNGLIEAVEDVLHNQGLLLLQPLKDGGVSSVIFDTESDAKIESFMLLPNIQDPQKLGSAITYFRRYTLESLLGLSAVDDDGNNASKNVNVVIPSEKLNKCKTLAELQAVYTLLTRTEQTAMLKLKDELKLKLK
jgi:hypothetical protein